QHPCEIIERGLRIGAAYRLMQRRNEIVMTFPVLVVDGDAELQEACKAGRIERLLQPDVEQGLGLIEKEPAVAVGTCDQRIAGVRRQRQRLFLELLSPFQ